MKITVMAPITISIEPIEQDYGWSYSYTVSLGSYNLFMGGGFQDPDEAEASARKHIDHYLSQMA